MTEQVDCVVVASQLEIALVGLTPALDHFENLDGAPGDGQAAWCFSPTVTFIALDANVHVSGATRAEKLVEDVDVRKDTGELPCPVYDWQRADVPESQALRSLSERVRLAHDDGVP